MKEDEKPVQGIVSEFAKGKSGWKQKCTQFPTAISGTVFQAVPVLFHLLLSILLGVLTPKTLTKAWKPMPNKVLKFECTFTCCQLCLWIDVPIHWLKKWYSFLAFLFLFTSFVLLISSLASLNDLKSLKAFWLKHSMAFFYLLGKKPFKNEDY